MPSLVCNLAFNIAITLGRCHSYQPRLEHINSLDSQYCCCRCHGAIGAVDSAAAILIYIAIYIEMYICLSSDYNVILRFPHYEIGLASGVGAVVKDLSPAGFL